jgi:uncharacterized membrane protein
MDSYLVFKWLHVFGAVLLLGNVTVTGFWAYFLFRQRSTVGLRPIARGILWTDLVFTLLGGTILTVSGILMTRARGIPILGTPWVSHGVYLLGLSTLLWLVFLLPDQLRMERADPADDARFRTLFIRWSIIGWISTVFLFAGLWVMVTKQ